MGSSDCHVVDTVLSVPLWSLKMLWVDFRSLLCSC